MAFPGSNVYTLRRALEVITEQAATVKSSAASMRAKALTDNTTSVDILQFLSVVQAVKARMQQAVSAVDAQSLATYAQQQYANAGLSISAEYAAMLTTLNAAAAWITGNFPKDANGYLLERSFDANGVPTVRTFTASALAAFRTQLDAVIAAVSG